MARRKRASRDRPRSRSPIVPGGRALVVDDDRAYRKAHARGDWLTLRARGSFVAQAIVSPTTSG
jgi:hypothetical protein